MAEMRTLGCPECGAPNQPLAVAEGIEEYRCRTCGLLYYGPCGCDIVHEAVGEPVAAVAQARAHETGADTGRLPDGFEMLLPVLPVEHASYVQKFPGCS